MNTFTKLSFAVALAVSSTAALAADAEGLTGSVAAVRVMETSSDSYGTLRGSMTVQENGGVQRTYQWGGQACNGRNLLESSVSTLAHNVANTAVQVTPYWKGGGGGVRCLVGFELKDWSLYVY